MLKVNVYLTSMDKNFADMNEAYVECFKWDPKPVRSGAVPERERERERGRAGLTVESGPHLRCRVPAAPRSGRGDRVHCACQLKMRETRA